MKRFPRMIGLAGPACARGFLALPTAQFHSLTKPLSNPAATATAKFSARNRFLHSTPLPADLNTQQLYHLARCYLEGLEGIIPDPGKAAVLLKNLAKKGHAGAQYHLALCYGAGNGVQADPYLHIKHLEDAAQAGNPDAQSLIGKYYLQGMMHLEKDVARGVDYVVAALRQGEKDPKAIACLETAARHGHTEAQRALEILASAGDAAAPENSGPTP